MHITDIISILKQGSVFRAIIFKRQRAVGFIGRARRDRIIHKPLATHTICHITP